MGAETVTYKDDGTFVLAVHFSGGCLSNWVFLFLPKDLVMIDLGADALVAAGTRAGIRSQFGAAGGASIQEMIDRRFGLFGPQFEATCTRACRSFERRVALLAKKGRNSGNISANLRHTP